MKKMILTFDWIDNGRGKSILADEREFIVKDEADVQKDIVAWVKEMYKADNGKHENFEVCRRYKMGTERMWIAYGTKSNINWSINFMSWAVMVMACTMNYLGWERAIETDQLAGKGYTFVSSTGETKKFKNLLKLDEFIQNEMKRLSKEG